MEGLCTTFLVLLLCNFIDFCTGEEGVCSSLGPYPVSKHNLRTQRPAQRVDLDSMERNDGGRMACKFVVGLGRGG
ncbi:hypothetical protein CC2G_002752 [Coprinopsis cinerea AmutBmut pab1-1]|nr:hypothetical protein CC2G_002752 [Coprinopsis cinerea AmutBmut pab1-1]